MLKDYDDPLSGTTYPFVVVRGAVSPSVDVTSLTKMDRIYYYPNAQDAELTELLSAHGTPDLLWLTDWLFNMENPREEDPLTRWEQEAGAANTQCLVYESANPIDPSSVDYLVHPYAYDNGDFLRIVFMDVKEKDLIKKREQVLEMARTVRLAHPITPKGQQILETAQTSRVSVDDFLIMMDDYRLPYNDLIGNFLDAAIKRHLISNGFDTDGGGVAGAKALAAVTSHNARTLARRLDAYETQVRLGASESDLAKMREAVRNYVESTFVDKESFAIDDMDDALRERTLAAIAPSPEVTACMQRLQDLGIIPEGASKVTQEKSASPSNSPIPAANESEVAVPAENSSAKESLECKQGG